MSKTPRLPSTQLHGELQGVWLLSTPTLQLSRVYLPSTCDITHVITYTRPSSLLFYFWVRGRGRPGDEASPCVYPCYLEPLPQGSQQAVTTQHFLTERAKKAVTLHFTIAPCREHSNKLLVTMPTATVDCNALGSFKPGI